MKLRDYQIKAKDLLKNEFAQGKKRVILCMPTGAGKTVTFAFMIQEAVKKGKICMIICDRKELISQSVDKLKSFGVESVVINPDWKGEKGSVYVASVDTLRNRELPEKLDLVIIDEAHKQNFDKTIERLRYSCDPYIIGATATPFRNSNQTALDSHYQAITEATTITELLEQNFLVNARTFSAKMDMSGVMKTMGDFSTKQMFDKFNKKELYAECVQKYKQFADGTKAIVFCVNVEHSINTAKEFKNEGYEVAHVDGNTPAKEREKILEDFKNGGYQILCNCGVLTTGFDEPSIFTVIVNRATDSLPLWLQMIGRGSRLFTDKKEFFIIDMGGNCYRHGLYDDVRTWTLKKKKKKEGIAPVKICVGCGLIIHASLRICKYCNCEQPMKEKEPPKKSEFQEVKKRKKIDLVRLKEIAKERGYKGGWVYYEAKKRGLIKE